MDMVECDDIRIKLRKSYKEQRGQRMFMINLIENLQTLQKFASLVKVVWNQGQVQPK